MAFFLMPVKNEPEFDQAQRQKRLRGNAGQEAC